MTPYRKWLSLLGMFFEQLIKLKAWVNKKLPWQVKVIGCWKCGPKRQNKNFKACP
jgi:hypothetical protein